MPWSATAWWDFDGTRGNVSRTQTHKNRTIIVAQEPKGTCYPKTYLAFIIPLPLKSRATSIPEEPTMGTKWGLQTISRVVMRATTKQHPALL
mmetsp:Transcript_8008/g.14272  ORF Transcript_8008/g.14272 Transcript_8008/m.14272 type:complete len:92 (+) Transcript_8008:203-478(+)